MLCNQGDSGADPPVTGHQCSGGDDEGYPHFRPNVALDSSLHAIIRAQKS